MKNSFLLFFLFLSFGSSCAEEYDFEEIANPPLVEGQDTVSCSFEKYMSLQPAGNYSVQGSACYGDYFIQGYNYNAYITIYNLKDKTCLGTIDIPAPAPSSRTHSNTVSFGSQRYDSNDFFPLLYVSSGYTTNGISHIYVYRLIKEEKDGQETFSISLVQTISLHGFGSWTEGVIDPANSYLWIQYTLSNQRIYGYYKLPNVFDGDVDINVENYIMNFVVDNTPIGSRNQGHLYDNGNILLVTGVPSSGEAIAFIIINTLTKRKELVIDLAEVGLANPLNPYDNTFEPEGVIIYNGQLMICYRTAIYSFYIKKERTQPEDSIATRTNVIPNDTQNKNVYNLLGGKQGGAKGIGIIQDKNSYYKVFNR